ncbi:Retrotransposon gag protein [Melia azedarach]|uniref:Retrotransposon gag protein n=1 Tax=Melia azedarach TaxID=155640 RepID=A0ACC1X5V3_MELAZ|nr:Retrotransposon gag protein [Melia azedarach]
MHLIMQMIKEIKDGNGLGSGNSESPRISSNRANPTRPQGMIPKLQFPTFDGTNPKNWVKKCSRYFALCNIASECRVNLASLYMTEKAENWVSSYLAVRKNVEWDDFIIDLCARVKDDKGMHDVEHFNKLEQGESLEDYIDEFENLRSIVLQNGRMLPDDYVLDSFIGGLKPAIKPFARAFNPTTTADAVKFARIQEE